MPTVDPVWPRCAHGGRYYCDLPADGEEGEALLVQRTRTSGIDLDISAKRFYKCDCTSHEGAQEFNPFQVLCVKNPDLTGVVQY